jgi:hypothetical protein
VRWHLTARPWQPLGITRSAYLDRVEKMATFWSQHLGANGAPVSPFNDAAKGYNPNPTFQYPDAVSTLVAAGRTTLATTGVKAEDYATTQYYNDTGGSKDNENFWLYPLVDAIGRFASSVTSSVLGTWQSRMSKMYGARAANNHQTYDMKGLWKQWLAGLISHATATNAISNDWTQTQQARWHAGWDSLYHDTSSNPDTLAVENVGRVNTLLLGTEGYDGPNASAMSSVAQKGTQTSLLLQNPAGEAPTGGRTDDHVWVDAGSQLAFELMAQHTADPWLAGQYQHAAELSFREQGLWDRGDGSFQVTKNWFDPTARVGYQTASNFGFYNGNQMMHTADAYNVRVKDVPENPAPAEIGGYAFALNDGFNQGFADAGGTMVQVALQGSTYTTLGDNWNALGIRRISRANWDLRLGPSDDHYDLTAGDGASFGPTWLESGKWVKLVQKAGKYAGTFKTLLATPALTYAQVVWAPTSGNSGPTFTQKLTITPDGVLSKTTSSAPAGSWGMTYPIMKDDGLHPTTQSISSTERLAQVSFTPGGDEQNYMLLNHNGDSLTPGNAIRSTYGNITPVQATTTDGENDTFVYPRNGTDPSAPTVRDSFAVTGDGYDSSIGAVHGTLYVGRTSAGGYGDRIDVNGDGQPDVTLSAKCDFTIQLSGGVITAIETDAPVTATVNGTAYSLAAYTPQTF